MGPKIKNYGIIADERKQSIELNPTELEIAKYLGEQKAEIGRTQIGFTEDTWYKHYLAYCGEIAFCKLMNIYHSPLIDPSHNFNLDKGDALWGDLKVDIKHSIYDPATLAVQKYAIDANVDIYVLVTGKGPTFKYQGAILKGDLTSEENFGNGPRGFEKAFCINSKKLDYFWYNK